MINKAVASQVATPVSQPVVPSAPKTRKEIVDNNWMIRAIRGIEGGINTVIDSAVLPAAEYVVMDATPVAAHKTAVALDYSAKKLCTFAEKLQAFATANTIK